MELEKKKGRRNDQVRVVVTYVEALLQFACYQVRVLPVHQIRWTRLHLDTMYFLMKRSPNTFLLLPNLYQNTRFHSLHNNPFRPSPQRLNHLWSCTLISAKSWIIHVRSHFLQNNCILEIAWKWLHVWTTFGLLFFFFEIAAAF